MSRRCMLHLLTLASVVVVGFQSATPARAATTVRVPALTSDCWIRSDGTAATTPQCFYPLPDDRGQLGNSSSTSKRRVLMRFPVADYLPARARVVSARLGAYVQARATTTAVPVAVHRVTRAWSGDVTWQRPSAAGSTGWTTAGGDLAAKSATTTIGGALGAVSWTLPTTVVDDWLARPEANFGVLLKQDNETLGTQTLTLASATNADTTRQPYVEVTYEPPTGNIASADMVFLGKRHAEDEVPYSLWRARGDGAEQEQVFVPGGPACGSPALSPDGLTVACVAAGSIVLRPLSGATPRTIYTAATGFSPGNPRFAPEGDRVIFQVRANVSPWTSELYIAKADGTGASQVGLPDYYYFLKPREASFSADGSKIVFVTSDDSGYDAILATADPDGTSTEIIGQAGYASRTPITSPRFVPDTKRVTYLEGSDLTLYTPNAEYPYSTQILLGSLEGTVDWDPDRPRMVTSAGRAWYEVTWGPDGEVRRTPFMTNFANVAALSFRQPVQTVAAEPDEVAGGDLDPGTLPDEACYDEEGEEVVCPTDDPASADAAPAPAAQAEAESSAALAGAAAVGNPFWGISDQNGFPAYDPFSDPVFGDMLVQRVRRVVPWDIMLERLSDSATPRSSRITATGSCARCRRARRSWSLSSDAGGRTSEPTRWRPTTARRGPVPR